MFKPMLAGTLLDVSTLKYPVLVSPKLDGIRASVQDGVLVSRKLERIPNEYTQKLFGIPELEGLDGELIEGDPTAEDVFRKTGSAVMSVEGEPNVTFRIFDMFVPMLYFSNRLKAAQEKIARSQHGRVCLVPHYEAENQSILLYHEEMWLAEGYEGLMVRSFNGPYKQGRSTLDEGYLLKWKRFVDAEAVVIGFVEAMQNNNVATKDKLGHAKRSSCKANKVPKGTLGSFRLLDLKTGVMCGCSTGNLTSVECQEIWNNREVLIGRTCRYKYFPKGSKDKPRFGEFQGWRDKIDM